nr:RecName: Full=Probable tyrosine-protein kinase kin-31 [Caenorhabditis elegans]
MSINSLSNETPTPTIEKEAYFHGLIQREDVFQLLDNNGDYVVRLSDPKPGEPRSYILSVMFNNKLDENSSVKHFVINSVENKYFVNNNMSFNTIQQMLSHYQKSRTEILEACKILHPVRRQFWELDHGNIVIEKKLGEGAFGEVSSGVMKFKRGGRLVKVAVKQVKTDGIGKDQIKDFLMEARTMRNLGHPNIVRFLGIAVLQEPLFLVMELATGGALDSYLKHNELLPIDKRHEMLLQAAWGLEYIHGKPMLHRDIAARNCLYGDGKVKISDFGLTRRGTIYQLHPETKSPIRWLAVCSQKTDVWAYGILCWEIFNNGAEPYPGLTANEVAKQVTDGYRMPPHQLAAPEVQALMTRCCAENPNDRPTMSDVAQILQRVTGQGRPNFAAIAKKEAEELLIMNSRSARRTSRRKGSNKKSAIPNGVLTPVNRAQEIKH